MIESMKVNIENFPYVMKTHDHEEADTIFILHCFDIERRDPFTTCTVYSTDKFLLLIHFYPSLPQSSLFHIEKGKKVRKIDIRSSYEGRGPSHAQALLGVHVLITMTRWATSQGIQKNFCGKNFKEQIRTHWMP